VLDFPAVLAQVSQRNFQMVTSIVFFNNPAPTLYNNLHSKSSGNIPGISDPRLDAALSDGLTSTDASARTSANQQIAARYRDLLPFLNTSRARFSLIFGDQLHGVTMYGAGAIRTDTMWMTS
jgi:peptide/nickel transport system substrate-binding protein